jgi:hypothetical protein
VRLENDLDGLLVKERVKFHYKEIPWTQLLEISAWCDKQFGKNNWGFDTGHVVFNGRCPEGSSTMFVLRWS